MLLELTFYCSLLAPGKAITASGTPAVPLQTLSVDRKVIRKGTYVRFHVPGLGAIRARADDTGSAVKGNIVDLFVGYGPSACALARRLGRIKNTPATLEN